MFAITTLRYILIVNVTIAMLFVSVSLQTVRAQSNGDKRVDLALNNADIHTLIEAVSKYTGKNFIVDPRVDAKVTVFSPGPVEVEKLYDMFLSVLQIHGFAAVPSGNFIKIVPAAVGVQSAVPLIGESVLGESVLGESAGNNPPVHDDELVSHVLRVEGAPVQALVAVLRPLIPSTATISAELNSNSLIITDRVDNLARVVDLVRSLVSGM